MLVCVCVCVCEGVPWWPSCDALMFLVWARSRWRTSGWRAAGLLEQVGHHGGHARQADFQPVLRPTVKAKSSRDKLKQEFPWLTEEDLDSAAGSKRATSAKRAKTMDARSSSSSSSEDGSADECSDNDEYLKVVQVDSAFVQEQLAGLRAEYEEDMGDDDGFRVKILGGDWTAEHNGAVADRISANAIGMPGRVWCRI